MTGLFFAHPEWLTLGVAWVAALATALVWAIARSRRFVRLLLGPTAFRSKDIRRVGLARAAGDVGLLLALVLVLVGLLGPRIGRETVQLSTSGIDVVMLIDTSRSMDAGDVPPSRIAAARRQLAGLLGLLGPGDRAALAVFAGRGVMLTPLTSDHAALTEMLAAVETSLVRPGGSNLPAGVRTALAAFEPVDERPRAIFILTDGEALGHPVDDATVAAMRANTRVFAAAFGSRQGATIPDHGVPLRDGSGEIVRTTRRLASLESISERTGGALFVADEWGHFDLEGAIRALRIPVAAAPGEFVAHTVTVPVVIPFAAAALLLLILEIALRGVRPGDGRAFAVTAVCALTLGASETARELGVPSAEALLRAGLEHAAHGSWPKAEARFRTAALTASDPELAAIAFHDVGVAALRQLQLPDARDAFFESLAATNPRSDPRRVTRTQWNLEWVLTRIAGDPEREPPPVPRQPLPSPEESDEERETGAAPPPTSAAPSQARGPRDRGMSLEREAEESASPAEKAPSRGEAPRELDERERTAWLERVADDPRRAFLSAAYERPEDRGKRATGRPTW